MLKNDFLLENAGQTCRYRESGLTFGFQTSKEGMKGCLLHCCIVTHDGGGYVKICDYDGGPLPTERIIVTRRRLENFGERKCNGCVFLRKPSEEKPNYLFDLLNFSHFSFCNLRCKYCYLMTPAFEGLIKKQKPFYQAAPAVREMIEKGWLDPNGEAHWGGGEPLLLSEFDELQSLCLDHGLAVTLNINATVVSETVLKYAHNPKQRIVCSVDAGSMEQYEETKGRNLGEKVWKNLKIYSDSGIRLILKYIVSDDNDNSDEFDKFLEKSKTINNPFIAVDLDYRKGIINDERLKFAKLFYQKSIDMGFESAIGGPGHLAFTEDPLL